MNKVCIELVDGRKMNIELYPEHAPITVENFLSLVKQNFYDGLCFHRVIENFMIQGGGYVYDNGLEEKHAPKTIKGEFKSNGVNNTLKHTAGVISMARTYIKDSASSQFFICTVNTPHLDGEYAAFGKVCDKESLQVAIDISKVLTGYVDYFADVPVDPIVIKTITEI